MEKVIQLTLTVRELELLCAALAFANSCVAQDEPAADNCLVHFHDALMSGFTPATVNNLSLRMGKLGQAAESLSYAEEVNTTDE